MCYLVLLFHVLLLQIKHLSFHLFIFYNIQALRKLINPHYVNADKNQNSSTTISSSENKLISPETAANTIDIEEELRELILLQLQSFCRDSIDEIGSMGQEMELLDHMEDLREIEELNLSSCSSSSSSRNCDQSSKHVDRGKGMKLHVG